jgi:ABC-type nitrate/sulfonate/bicarbonate transport system substrate-binding protein
MTDPYQLVAIVYARPPHAIYVLKDSGIANPKDLEGKKIADPRSAPYPNCSTPTPRRRRSTGAR